MARHHNPYEQFRSRELTLNDHLAIDRTVLSNERTLLAYGRTALAMGVIGGTAIKFFASPVVWTLGWVFIVAGVLLMVAGWTRYRRTRKFLLVALRHRLNPTDQQTPPDPQRNT